MSIDALMATAYLTHKDVMSTMIAGITLMKLVVALVLVQVYSGCAQCHV